MHGDAGNLGAAGGGAGGTTSGPRAKCDQVIFEALAKATEIIVASRVGASASANGNSLINQSPKHQQHQQQRPQVGGYYPQQNHAPISSRFNLSMPENPALRNILQRWRRALHLPIRLDVYYEHEDNRRELLERWCLEYVIGDAFWRDQHNAVLSKNSADPIVQLRHVCKKIVIWLRTLYCFARLLPSAAFFNGKTMYSMPSISGPTPSQQQQHLGFSLYAVSEDSGDIAQLKEQGFLHQGQPSSAVTTPYGELSWQVLYAPSDTVERLAPRRNHATVAAPGNFLRPSSQQQQYTPSQSIPIATNTIARLGVQQHSQVAHHFGGGGATPPKPLQDRRMTHGGIPQSAPVHMHHYLSNDRTGNRTEKIFYYNDNNTADDGGNRHGALPQQNTYNPRMFSERDRRSTVDDPLLQQNLQQRLIPPHGLLQRRHTSIMDGGDNGTNTNISRGNSGEKPQRVRSGLSLALMMSDGNNNNSHENINHEAMNDQQGDPSPAEPTNAESKRDAIAAEKRRAALHQMPPHLQHSSPTTRPMSNEYGYAYNNHIPWERLRSETGPASAQTPDHHTARNQWTAAGTQQQQQQPDTSPLFGTTPPSGVFLGTVDPTATPPLRLSSFGNLLPPRNLSTVNIAPPFATRPPGFSQDNHHSHHNQQVIAAPLAPQVQQQQHQEQSGAQERNLQGQQQDMDVPPLTSLDMLHHSPFHFGHHHGGSMLSSLSGGPAVFGSEAASLFYSSVNAEFRKSAGGGISISNPSEDYEEMPFAVDQEPFDVTSAPSSSNAPTGAGTSSHLLASSAAVASFAQKCSMHQRLELFDRSRDSGASPTTDRQEGKYHDDDMNQLADQLADFRSFGESLRLSVPSSTT
ncbi:hypothetical protein ACA910_011324 [Epithemia clementina (nom. ined.)]